LLKKEIEEAEIGFLNTCLKKDIPYEWIIERRGNINQLKRIAGFNYDDYEFLIQNYQTKEEKND
jgi:hypothetical protein